MSQMPTKQESESGTVTVGSLTSLLARIEAGANPNNPGAWLSGVDCALMLQTLAGLSAAPTCDVEAAADSDAVVGQALLFASLVYEGRDIHDDVVVLARRSLVRAVLAHVHPQPREKGDGAE